jgi:hypothetical protein
MDNDENGKYAILTCVNEKVAQEVLEWINNHKPKCEPLDLSIKEEEIITCIEDLGKQFKKVYEIQTNADCSVSDRNVFWEKVDYFERTFVRHWNGSGYGESSISYEDAWKKNSN